MLILTGLSPYARANIAAPFGITGVAGDILSLKGDGEKLRIEKEILVLDLRENASDPEPCSATYRIVNPENTPVKSDLIFLSPEAHRISISIDGQAVSSVTKIIDINEIPWAREDEFPREIRTYTAEQFSLECPPGERKSIEVRFRLSPGWHNMSGRTGPTAPQAAHLLNLFRDDRGTQWYVYDLFASHTFKGGFSELELIVKTPGNATLLSNLDLMERPVPADIPSEKPYRLYAETFDEIPVELLDIKLMYPVEYNFLGVTAGYYGCHFPFDGRPVQWLTFSGSIDLYFLNHQLSCGIEGDPVNKAFNLCFLYTMYPPGKSDSFFGYLIDIRGGGGVLIDYVNDESIGFRIFAGLKFLVVTYELYYDFYPFIDDGSFRHGVGVRTSMAF